MAEARTLLIAKIGATAAALAVALVTAWEGYRARVYYDPVGRLAVCYGHDDQKLTPGDKYSAAECRAILDADLLLHAEALDCVEQPARGELPDGIKAALVSFAFNVGVSKACGSTFVHRLSAGDGRAACEELSNWVYAGGKVMPGLLARRDAERAMCESGA